MATHAVMQTIEIHVSAHTVTANPARSAARAARREKPRFSCSHGPTCSMEIGSMGGRSDDVFADFVGNYLVGLKAGHQFPTPLTVARAPERPEPEI